jgi:hypothetical protein
MRENRKNTPVKIVGKLTFSRLVDSIQSVHRQLAAQASKAVNMSLTLRNWLIGCYIREYEQNGADRAQYGARLLDRLADRLHEGLDRCYTGRYLGLCRQLFDTYPEIRKSLISESALPLLPLPVPNESMKHIRKSAISELHLQPHMLVERLSFTHLVELIALEDPLKRAFYESECVIRVKPAF